MAQKTDPLLQELLSKFLDELGATATDREPRGLYAPVDYVLALGGKRIRPLVTLLAGRMFGDDDSKMTLPAALAVEVFHNFTLLHDDIMDDSPLRRGHATVHEKWDVNTAILSGDLMLIRAYEHLCDAPNKGALPDLLCTFNRVAVGVCEGQQFDVNFEQRDDVTIQEYLKMIELKTAVLLGGALELGALAAGAARADADHLYAFGRLTGIAFQLQDDLLDTFGDSAQTGKLTGNDIIRNKKTFLFLKTAEILGQSGRDELNEWYATSPTNPQEKVARVTALMEQADIPRLVAAQRDQFQAEAYAHLDAAGGDPATKEVLRSLAESLLQRQH